MKRKYVGRDRLYAAILREQRERPNRHPFNRRKPNAVSVRFACTPTLAHCLDGFYGEIDRRIREWDYRRDLEIGCAHAESRHRREMRHDRAMYRLLRADAIRRGIV